MTATRGLLDTSVLIASEAGRALQTNLLPDESYVSVVTLAELQLGVLAATDSSVRSRRLATLTSVAALDPLTIDGSVALEWARLRVALAEADGRMNANDLWIAAVAAANRLPVVTQDTDFDLLDQIGAVEVIRV